MGTIKIALILVSAAAASLSAPWVTPARSQQPSAGANVGPGELAGVVRGPNGPEAGVWVIAETTDLPTRLAKIVATDDQGRYLIPDLPKASYSVWVRGYGLVDSPKVAGTPGKLLDLTAVKIGRASCRERV